MDCEVIQHCHHGAHWICRSAWMSKEKTEAFRENIQVLVPSAQHLGRFPLIQQPLVQTAPDGSVRFVEPFFCLN